MRSARLLPALAILSALPSVPILAADAPKPRAVLVEADGRDEELSAFVARLESELSDAGKVSFSDARLSGATLGALVAEPDGEATRSFRKEWPGDLWLGASVAPCSVKVSRMSYWDTTPEGYRVERVVENVSVACDVTLRLVDAATTKEKKALSVTGTASYKRDEGGEGESSELEGVREAARKAAKKLAAELKR